MKRVDIQRSLVLIVVLIACGASIAFAAEGKGESESEGISSLIPFWVNFILYIGLIYFLVKDKARVGWEKRVSSIEAAVTQGSRDLEAAQRELNDARAAFSKIDHEIRAITERTAQDAENECRKIIEEANTRAALSIARAKDLAQSEARAFADALRREVADLVLEKATQRLKSEWNIEKDRSRRDCAINGVKALIQ